MSEAKEREVQQLLRDYRAFVSNFGGAMPLDETGVLDANYGPAGLVFKGAGFEKRDVPGLLHTYRKLNVALRLLRKRHFEEWAVLVEPYLSDVADSGVVDEWRRKIAALDAENEGIRRSNAEREELLEKGKKAHPYRYERTALVFTRMQLERHDRAVMRLAYYLTNVDLSHAVFPKLMSEREKAAGEAANAQIYAYYQRIRVAGRTHRGAVQVTATKFEIPEDAVERVIEFRADVKLATCAEEGCPRGVFQQNLCQKHYQRDWRARKRVERSA